MELHAKVSSVEAKILGEIEEVVVSTMSGCSPVVASSIKESVIAVVCLKSIVSSIVVALISGIEKLMKRVAEIS